MALKFFILFILFMIFGQIQIGLAQTCKSFYIENQQTLPQKSGVNDIDYSPDGRFVVISNRDGTAVIKNLATGGEKTIKHFSSITASVFSPTNEFIATASNDESVKLENLVKGNIKTIKHSAKVNGVSFSPDGKLLLTLSDDKTSILYNIENESKNIFETSDYVNAAKFSPNGKMIGIASYDGSILLKNLESNIETKLKFPESVNTIAISPDGKNILISTDADAAIVYNLDSKKQISIEHSGNVNMASFSPDGKSIITASEDNTSILYHLETGKKEVFTSDDSITSAKFSPDGNSIVFGGDNGIVTVHHLESGRDIKIKTKSRISSVSFSPDSQNIAISSMDGNAYIQNINTQCLDDTQFVEMKNNLCETCSDISLIDKNNETTLTKLAEENLCQQEFNAKDWANSAPQLMKSPIAIKDAKKYLLKLQKLNSFDPQNDLPILMAIYKSDLVHSDPDLVLGSLQTILHLSKSIYNDVLNYFPKLLLLSPFTSGSIICRTPKEIEMLKKDAINYLKYLKAANPEKTYFSDWNNLLPLKSVLTQLSPAAKDEWMNSITQSISDNAATSNDFKNVFLSKIYAFTNQAVAPIFGLAQRPLTDLTLTRERNKITPIVLGVSKLDNDDLSKTPFGFYAKVLPSIFVPESDKIPKKLSVVKNKKIAWQMNGENYSSNLNIEATSKKSIIPIENAPNYNELWKDKVLSGIVIAGSNLQGISTGVMNEYLAYYQNNGFEFEPNPTDVLNVQDFLKEQIQSGSIDYFIKEAHSDGDEKNLFRIDLTNKLRVGHKINADGTSEKIYLLFPDAKLAKTSLLSNQEFGLWLKEREKKGGGQLVYFNTSCWSQTKALNEIEASQSSLLLNIPSSTIVRTFKNSSTNAEQLLFTSFREKKNYDEIRNDLRKNEGYKNAEENVFLFPDEDKYKKSITDVLNTPLNIDLKIVNSKGIPYEIDSVH